MRIVAQKTLREFWQAHADAEQPLRSWYAEAESEQWSSPGQVKQRYAHVSILPCNRLVFNIGGNKYRLVVVVHYNTGFVYVRFVGTHAEYDKIDAERI